MGLLKGDMIWYPTIEVGLPIVTGHRPSASHWQSNARRQEKESWATTLQYEWRLMLLKLWIYLSLSRKSLSMIDSNNLICISIVN